jgi:hypothetical protein
MNKYGKLVLAGSFAVGDGWRYVNSALVNAVAELWSQEQHDWDPIRMGTDQSRAIFPL